MPKYRVAETVEGLDDGPIFNAASPRIAAGLDAEEAGEGMSDSFESFVRCEETGKITRVEVQWIPGYWRAEEVG